MSERFKGWGSVAEQLVRFAEQEQAQELARGADARIKEEWHLDRGQRASLRAIAQRLPENGVIIADEVGMGKTRVAVAVARAVVECGGRVAILVPPGLGAQWGSELRGGKVANAGLLRSLAQYFTAWDTEHAAGRPWFGEQLVLLSHGFANWKVGRSDWRWSLLPELYAAWRQRRKPDSTQAYGYGKRDHSPSVVSTAASIVDMAQRSPHIEKWLDALLGQVDGSAGVPRQLLSSSVYGRGQQWRPWLEQAVGAGLGMFDLVIIDEAHKSRSEDSGLARLLGNVLHTASRRSRTIALTATPIELDATQWVQALDRIGAQVDAQTVVSNYALACRQVRRCVSDAQQRLTYAAASAAFQDALSCWLLRRDRRDDIHVQAHAKIVGGSRHGYRRNTEISIDPSTLPDEWLDVVCAAESLSLVGRGARDSVSINAKRLRLTVGNGHGIASLIDRDQRDTQAEQLDRTQDVHDAQSAALDEEQDAEPAADHKKAQQRAAWWREAALRPFQSADGPLYDHPATLAAVQAIETVTSAGEKVLVFGRYTQPMQNLVNLLNAREMLRCLDGRRPWPQATVHQSEWQAIQAAHRQLEREGALDRDQLNVQLESQYGRLEANRERNRAELLSLIGAGLDEAAADAWMKQLYAALQRAANHTKAGHAPALSVLARAMHDIGGSELDSLCASTYARLFIELVDAMKLRSDEDPDEEVGDEDADHIQDANQRFDAFWKTIYDRLSEEYVRQEGNFARLMHGDTSLTTRHNLQLAFNRAGSYPKVLVAQSMVGREGLNLQRACRTVVLLHPEWNPGVVEQQIGRVDRLGSLWKTLMQQAMDEKADPKDVPNIEVMPVIFRGTYDEAHWNVLKQRWDDLRAQLCGVVVPEHVTNGDPALRVYADEINAAAPDFSPPDIEGDVR